MGIATIWTQSLVRSLSRDALVGLGAMMFWLNVPRIMVALGVGKVADGDAWRDYRGGHYSWHPRAVASVDSA
jgi:hypothetical protein